MKNKRGITLIALILTVIVMLILAAVSFDALMGDNGIVTQAMKASENTNRESAKDELLLAWSAGMARFNEDLAAGKTTEKEKYTYFTMAKLNEYLGTAGVVKGLKYDSESSEYTIVYTSKASGKSYQFKISSSGNLEVLKSDVDLASDEVELGEEIINYKIYAIYYPDTKTLAFSNDGTGLENQGTTEPIVWNNENNSFISTADESVQVDGYQSLAWSSYSYFNIKKVVFLNNIYPTDMSYWFCQCYYLETIEGIENVKTSQCTNMRYLFYHLGKLESLDLSSWDTSNVTNMKSMFDNSYSFTSLNLRNFNTLNVTNMMRMFNQCENLLGLDLSSFNTTNVTNMDYMFNQCRNMTYLTLGKDFNMKSITSVKRLFSICESLNTIDISSFDLSNMTSLSSLFYNCKSLTTVIFGDNFDTSTITDMSSMFYGCEALENVDLSVFNTSNVTNMSYMFRGCHELKNINLTSFDTSDVANMSGMFNGLYYGSKICIGNQFVVGSGTNTQYMMYAHISNGDYSTTLYNKFTRINTDDSETELTLEQLKAN